jgi:hypothetical protein
LETTIPQKPAGGMVYYVTGHDEFSDICLVISDVEMLDTGEAHPAAVERK